MPRRPKVDPEVALSEGIANVPQGLSAECIRETAKKTKWVQRIKKVDPI